MSNSFPKYGASARNIGRDGIWNVRFNDRSAFDKFDIVRSDHVVAQSSIPRNVYG